MSPITHFLAGWTLANMAKLNPRDRMLVSVAGVIPDVDGFGIVVDFATRHSTDWWGRFHHELGHNIGFCLLVTAVFAMLAQRKAMTAWLVFLSFHLHLLGDLVGARGPDGDQWPIPYLEPFSAVPRMVWSGQWPLNGWPNMLITGIMIALAVHWARQRGFSPLEMFSKKADGIFVETLRRRFPVAQAN
ncbi:MAG TPA: metal-dependent hydrolase [Roseimicrobium sp.]|nr:metal-dependent hydrolase [Roseimicrobium sp.]